MINYGSKNKVKLNAKDLLAPGILSSIVAIIIYFSRLTFPVVITNTCTMLGSITPPISMLVIGSTLAAMPLREVFNDLRVYGYTFIKQIIIPVIAFPILSFFIKDTYILGIVFIIIAMPVANSAVLFSTQYDGDVKLAAKTVFLTTLLSVATIPALVYIFLI